MKNTTVAIEGRLRGDAGWTRIEEETSIAAIERRMKAAYFKTEYREDPTSHLIVINPIGNVVECEYREIHANA